jgi:membrane-associated phospholipid phosphatase
VRFGWLRTADATLATRLNAIGRQSIVARRLAVGSASGLAGVEVMLMGALFVGGRPRSAARMLAAVGLVYAASELLGRLWPRQRPFAEHSAITGLLPHSAERSFPSRHVASGLAMAAIGRRAHPLLGLSMSCVAWLLGVSRVVTGLHYPSDVLAGAVLGLAVGRLLRERN